MPGPPGKDALATAATLQQIGGIKTNLQLVQKATASVPLPALSLLSITPIAATPTVTVAGVQLGDTLTLPGFVNAPPAGLIVTAAQVVAADKVTLVFAAISALTLPAGARDMNFVWMR